VVSQAAGSLLVINDRIDVALAAGVEAVQLGSQSLQQNTVNRLAPQLRVGVSIHSPQEIQNAHNADWVMAGHIYETSTHPATLARGPEFIRTIVQNTMIPVIAIGGIGPEHVAPILRLGVAGVAVITGIWNERTPKNAALRYLSYLW
jgi:thiazole tautomerase (transcriptional regulator TenI)